MCSLPPPQKLGLGPKLVPCFEYLMIPASEHRPYEVMTAKLPLRDDGCVPAGDQIPNLVKSHFANQGRSQTVRVAICRRIVLASSMSDL